MCLSGPRPAGDPLPGRRRRPGGQGGALREPARPGRSRRVRPPLRAPGSGRDRLPRHRRRSRGAGHRRRLGPPHGEPGVHPADRRRRRAQRGGRHAAAPLRAPTRSGSTPPPSSGRSCSPSSPAASAASAWCSRWTPAGRTSGWEVVTRGGRLGTGLDALAWIREGVERGAGEILLTSIDRDGTQGGYDLELIERVAAAVPVPVIASGGAGEPAHLVKRPRRRRRRRARRVDLPSGNVYGGGRQTGDRGGGVPGAGRANEALNRPRSTRHPPFRRPRPASRRRPGRRQRRRADARLRRPRGGREDAGDRPRALLEPLAVCALEEGGDLRQHPPGGRGDRRLRRRRAAGAGASGGPTCHRGTRSCFEPNPARLELGWLAAVLASRRGADPDDQLHGAPAGPGIERIAQKVGEEGVETAIAAVSAALRGPGEGDERRRALTGEAADLLYHLLVLLQASGVDPGEITEVLLERHGFAPSGHS